MNTDHILAQQQALFENVLRINFAMLVISVAMMIFAAWVVYMFYARFRDIAEELRRFRVAFQHAEDLKYDPRSRPLSSPPRPGNPSSPNPDEKYMPK